MTNTNENETLVEINRLKSEYQAISNSTTDIDESLRRFELILQIVKHADRLGTVVGNTYSGEVICDYQYAVRQIINRLWDIRFSKKANYHNEQKALQIKASSLFDWKASNHGRWWNDSKDAHDYESARTEVEKLISEIGRIIES